MKRSQFLVRRSSPIFRFEVCNMFYLLLLVDPVCQKPHYITVFIH